MRCPKCGKDMQAGYLQTTKIVAFNKRKHKLSLNPACEDDVMIARKAFAGTGFPGFICKACGCVLSDYQNDTLGFTPPFVGKLKMGCGLFRRAMPRCIYNPS